MSLAFTDSLSNRGLSRLHSVYHMGSFGANCSNTRCEINRFHMEVGAVLCRRFFLNDTILDEYVSIVLYDINGFDNNMNDFMLILM